MIDLFDLVLAVSGQGCSALFGAAEVFLHADLGDVEQGRPGARYGHFKTSRLNRSLGDLARFVLGELVVDQWVWHKSGLH